MVKFGITLGRPEANRKFIELHKVLLTNLESLKNAFQSFADAMVGKENNPLDRAIYYLGYIAWEDFNEILLLCANGMENGAKKILRGMFERVVTARYLHKYPEDADLFWDYFWVDMFKVAGDLEKVFPGTVPPIGLAEIQSNYDKVKRKRKFSNRGWSKQSIIKMAEDVGMPLHVVKCAYYLPLMETHPTASSIIDRMKLLEKGVPNYDVDGTALMLAHGLLLSMLEILNEHFGIEEMRAYLDNANDDFHKAWQGKAERVENL